MSEHSKQLLCKLLSGQQREPPLFDWHGQLELADEIIARVGAPVGNNSISHRPSRPMDLRPHREAVAKLMAELQEAYLCALGDYEMRNDPQRPERKLRKKDIARYGVPVGPATGFDYSAFVDDTPDNAWEQHWDEVYRRQRGNPGRSRLGGLPITPLYMVLTSVRRWWRSQGLGAFNPIFNCEANEGEGYQAASYNAPLRFLFAVIQTLDPDYTIENVRSVCDTRRKNQKTRKSE